MESASLDYLESNRNRRSSSSALPRRYGQSPSTSGLFQPGMSSRSQSSFHQFASRNDADEDLSWDSSSTGESAELSKRFPVQAPRRLSRQGSLGSSHGPALMSGASEVERPQTLELPRTPLRSSLKKKNSTSSSNPTPSYYSPRNWWVKSSFSVIIILQFCTFQVFLGRGCADPSFQQVGHFIRGYPAHHPSGRGSLCQVRLWFRLQQPSQVLAIPFQKLKPGGLHVRLEPHP